MSPRLPEYRPHLGESCPYHDERPADAAWDGTCSRQCAEQLATDVAVEAQLLRHACPEIAGEA